MQRSLILILIITLLMVIFALQNSVVINLRVWFWTIEVSAGLILIITFIVGTLLGIVSSAPSLMKRNKQIRQLSEQLTREKEQDDQDRGDSSADPEFEDVVND